MKIDLVIASTGRPDLPQLERTFAKDGDDDFIVGDDHFLNMFGQDGLIVGANGEIIADGVNSPA
jgi:hypothetical protein